MKCAQDVCNAPIWRNELWNSQDVCSTCGAMKYAIEQGVCGTKDMQYEKQAGSCWCLHHMKNKTRLGLDHF